MEDNFDDIYAQECGVTAEWLKPMAYANFFFPKSFKRNPDEEVKFLDCELPYIGKLLRFGGQNWSFLEEMELEWTTAADDRRRSIPPIGPNRFFPNTPVHIHSTFMIDDVKLHADFLTWSRTGPNNGFYEYRVYRDKRLVNRGGNAGLSIGGNSIIHWPLASVVNDYLILFWRYPSEKPPITVPKPKIYCRE